MLVPAVARTVPPQVLNAVGDAVLTNAPEYTSVKATPVMGTSLGFVMTMLSRTVALMLLDPGLKDLLTTGLRSTLVVSLAVLFEEPAKGSPPPPTTAELTTDTAADEVTETLMVRTGNEAPTASAGVDAGWVQTTLGPGGSEQVQPVPAADW